MNNNKTLLAGLGFILGPIHSIGVPGQQGFGVGYYGGSSSILSEMGLTPLPGHQYINHPNYGNYQHTNQSIMCCVPAFCYRLGRSSAPSYSRDGANALEITDATKFPQFAHGSQFNGNADFGDGWILHRAFIDGGKMKNCFFMDKYLCSNNGNGQAASIKNADQMTCNNNTAASTNQFGGDGKGYDAITFSRARGNHYSLTTVYQWSAMSMLSLAHGQAATSASYCAWYDSAHLTNFPKGDTNGGTDYNDSSIQYADHLDAPLKKTGSSNQPAKVSHNGQLCGIMDVAGMGNQLCIGATCKSVWNGTSTDYKMGLMKLSVSAHDFTKDNRVDDSLHDSIGAGFGDGSYYFSGLRRGTSGSLNWAACGVIPVSTTDDSLFGNDEYVEDYGSDIGMKMGSGRNKGAKSGVFCRCFTGYRYNRNDHRLWSDISYSFIFRAAGYAP